MTAPKGKQRSIHMDDETFDLLKSLAAKHKASNSTIVRMALAAYASDPYARMAADINTGAPATREQAQAALAAPYTHPASLLAGADARFTHPPTNGSARDIALPDPAVSSFKVAGDKVIGKRPRNEREDDGLDV